MNARFVHSLTLAAFLLQYITWPLFGIYDLFDIYGMECVLSVVIIISSVMHLLYFDRVVRNGDKNFAGCFFCFEVR
ncbi:hypothetical protein PMAYCL1PPCAC_21654 [Pristionchus mayeri]|uniref:Uncharacterized protein n=1 Tax=Pristionchus mayeri TaxID=1317129 RepID=A0AAN5CWI4_9BILA|nr:hypothetical protein PMAYCL1PPCAC_21654 [Pristionchus mayeri]